MPQEPNKKSRLSRFLTNVFVAFGAVLFILALVECGLQLYYKNKNLELSPYRQQSLKEVYSSRFVSHPYLPYAARPAASQSYIYKDELHDKTDTIIYSTNELGFRFPLKSYQKEAKEKVIVFLGGSTTWDGPDDEHTWPAILTRSLNKYYGDKHYKIKQINLAVDGANSAQSLTNLMLTGVCFQPDLVISYDGINDFYDLGQYKKTLPDYSDAMHKFDDRIKPSIRHFPAFMHHLILVHIVCNAIDKMHYGNMDVYSQTYKPLPIPSSAWQVSVYQSFSRNIRCMRAISKEYNSPFLAAIPHVYQPGASYFEFRDSMQAHWQTDSIEYINMLDSIPANDAAYHYDPVHFTPPGLQAVANVYAQYIISHNLLKIE